MSTPRTLSVLFVTAVLTAALLGAGCGVSTDDSAHVIDSKELPSELRADDNASSTVSVPRTPANLYFVDGDHLVVALAAVAAPATLEQSVAALVAGPSRSLATSGIRTALSASDLVGDVDSRGGIATIELRPGFDLLAADERLLAIAQLVLTATARGDVNEVRLTRKGELLEVPRADGTLVDGPVTEADYAAMVQNV
jgi:spore germination protein GerM